MTDAKSDYPSFEVTKVEVVASEPNSGELRKILSLVPDTDERTATTYLVKIYLQTLPEPAGANYELWIGDQKVRKYTQFKGGIYFKLYDVESVNLLDGAPICFRRDGEDICIPMKNKYVMHDGSKFLKAIELAPQRKLSRREALDE
jgi:hypothetical protein